MLNLPYISQKHELLGEALSCISVKKVAEGGHALSYIYYNL